MIGRYYATCLLLMAFTIPWANSDTTPAPPDSTTPEATSEATTEDPTTTQPTTTPAPQLDPIETYNFDTALGSLQGEYVLKARRHEQSRPTWASIWPINNDEQQFAVYFWPPKYCHAIYLCPVPGQVYDGKKTFKEFECDKSFMKYYPHINKLTFKPSETAPEEVYYHMSYSLQFKSATPGHYSIKFLEERPDSHDTWKLAKRKSVTWDLTDTDPATNQPSGIKQLLILTNSRMCEINKPGASFHPIFDQEFQQNKDKTDNWPNWLTYPGTDKTTNVFNENFHVATDYLPPLGGGVKTIDLLHYVKGLTYSDKGLGNVVQKCNAFEKISVFGTRKPIFESSSHVSVVSYQLDDSMANFPKGHSIKLQFTITRCDWVRFWMTDADIKDYATAMKPSETLDLFISQGFYIAPDSNVAQPLPDSLVMSKLKLEVHRQHDGHQEILELNEMAFGAHGDNYLFRQFFKSADFGARSRKLHVIRAPHCETNIISDNMYYNQFGTDELSNRRTARKCSYSFFFEKKQ